MLYEVLARIIGALCLHAGTPLSATRISQLLDHLFDVHLVESACLRMQSEGKLFHVVDGTFTVRSMYRRIAYTHILITREYRELGMALMELDSHDWARRILPDAEHRFLEIKPSTIGGASGMGLFVRSSRRIPLGCIICEYRGRELTARPADVKQGIYVVHVRNTGSYIDGVTEGGEHLSLATFINDNGPLRANAGMMEYARHPGRVFVVANRDIQPGEEIFVLYGATYWGFTSYSELARQARQHHQDKGRHAPAEAPRQREGEGASNGRTARKRQRRREASRADDAADELSDSEDSLRVGIARPCPLCGDLTIDRAIKLHRQHCGDPLARKKVLQLDCMPFNEFTAVDTPRSVLSTQRSKAHRRARALVKLTNPQTLSHTHTDAVRNLEFTFEEAEEETPSTATPMKPSC